MKVLYISADDKIILIAGAGIPQPLHRVIGFIQMCKADVIISWNGRNLHTVRIMSNLAPSKPLAELIYEYFGYEAVTSQMNITTFKYEEDRVAFTLTYGNGKCN